jgi:hypothetical protein
LIIGDEKAKAQARQAFFLPERSREKKLVFTIQLSAFVCGNSLASLPARLRLESLDAAARGRRFRARTAV